MTVLLTTLLLVGCQMQSFSGFAASATSETILVIRSGTSFGECLGYCWNEIQINPEQTRLVRRFLNNGPDDIPGPGGAPDLLFQRPTDPETWDRLVALTDFGELSTLESVYGCPDCADGGAEWVEVETTSGKKKITFEYGADIVGIADLAELLRTLRQGYIDDVTD